MLEGCWHADPNQRPSMASLARFFASAAPTIQEIIQCSEQATRNLTGQVRLTETQPFADGGFAEVWKGEWTSKSSEKSMVVKCSFFLDEPPDLSNI